MNKVETVTGTITNSCSCTVYDDTTGEYTDEISPECYGECWAWSVEMFTEDIAHILDSAETNFWRVENLKLWDREISGIFHARKVEDILRGMAVNGEWTMRYTVYSDRIEYSLSHHDAPCGSSSVLRAVTEEQRQEWGLY